MHINYSTGIFSYAGNYISLIERILEEEDQSFVPCFPAPVDTASLRNGPPITSQFVGWYGVLFTYVNHTSVLLQDEEMPQEVLNELNFTLRIMVPILQLFSKVVSITTSSTMTC